MKVTDLKITANDIHFLFLEKIISLATDKSHPIQIITIPAYSQLRKS